MKQRILLVEDEAAVARLLLDNLRAEGYEVAWSPMGRDVTEQVKSFAPDLVLLDLMLPNGVDGFEICRYLAGGAEPIPTIVLTARGERRDRVKGLSLGADDYVVKPFALDELLCRIQAVLRRTSRRVAKLRLGNTVVDFKNLRAFTRKGRDVAEVHLTDREFEVLRHMAKRSGSVVTRDELLRLIWGTGIPAVTRAVDNLIFCLRRKIEPDPHRPRYIHTAYGGGYRLVTDN